MEHLPSRDATGIQVSLEMVDTADIYIGIYAWRYGWIPEFSNSGNFSITEMEFDRAQELKDQGKLKEILVFIMDDDHMIRPKDKEDGEDVQRKLKEFKQRASSGRNVRKFKTKDELEGQIIQALASYIERCPPDRVQRKQGATAKAKGPTDPATAPPLPKPPAFYAAPAYIGRTNFFGRKAQLQTLNEWAQPTDKTSVLLFEAIGGNGKSMLTWEWTTKHATEVRGDWAGRFWYSFYEKGAVMRQFCQHALAYMKQQPLEAFEMKSTPEMREALFAELRQKPWLLILDGLERVLVAYHRIDAAEVRDEDLNRPTDMILDREPCDAIRDEDTEILRSLAAADPSKILISSRLIPRALLNPAGLPIPGVRPVLLPGMDEADAEALLRSFGVLGMSADIRYYLTNYCGNHPLVIGVLAGLINAPGPHRGHFDSWAADPSYGAKLNLASLDLIQSRNHILRAAMDALEPMSRQLLSTLALISSAVDYETVAAFNPHLPPEPETVKVPMKPEDDDIWDTSDAKEKAELRKKYKSDSAKRKAYEKDLQEWSESDAVHEASRKLTETMTDLEQRGLLHYDPHEQRYDLHPVVRGVAAGSLKDDEKERYGQKVVDHFNSQPHSPYEQAKTIEDVESGLQVVRTLLKLGRHQQAADAYTGDVAGALLHNLEAHVEMLSLLRPLFPLGWDQLPKDVDLHTACYLANDAAIGLAVLGEDKQEIGVYAAVLRVNLESKLWINSGICLSNISNSLSFQNQLAKAQQNSALLLDLASASEDDVNIFIARLDLYKHLSRSGLWLEAEAMWNLIDPMGRQWNRTMYRQGSAEGQFAMSKFWQGRLQENHLSTAATLAEQDHNRHDLRALHSLRGAWRMEQGEWALAATSFTQAVTMAREVRLVDEASETGLALAKFHLGKFTDDEARNLAERLASMRKPEHRTLALLWQAVRGLEQAKHHAVAAYTRAWADGEPHVRRYELTKTTELLHELGIPIPNLPPYDPSKDLPLPWEADVQAVIEKLRKERTERKEKKEREE